jgi:hypothetical protein
MKTCKRCLIEKNITEFGNNKNEKDGKSIYCSNCELIRGREYREKNKDKVNQSAKKWREDTPEKYKETIKRYIEKNPHMSSKERSKRYRLDDDYRKKISEKRKEYYQNNIEKEREKRKLYYYSNREIERKKNDDWREKKLKTDGFFRMKRRLRERIRDYMNGDTIQAINYYKQSLEATPKQIYAMNNLGTIYVSRNNVDSAYYYFNRTYLADTTNPMSITNYLIASFNKGYDNQVIYLGNQASKFNYYSKVIYELMSKSYARKGNNEESQKYLQLMNQTLK